jgi:sugar phosphate isomerase/epimerase
MKLAICNELFEPLDWETTCQRVAGYGYAGIEIAPYTMGAEPTRLPMDMRQEWRRIAADQGLEIVGLHWLLAKTAGYHLTSPDRGVREKTTDYLKGLVELTANLGGGVMVFGSPGQRSFGPDQNAESANECAMEVLRNLVPVLETQRVVLALEPLSPAETNFWNTAKEVSSLLDGLDSPWVQLHLDVKAMASEQKAIAGIIRSSAEKLVHFHANDPNRLGPGMGLVDYHDIVQALRDVNYEGWLSVEVFDFSPGYDLIAEQSINYLRRQLDVS